MKGGPATWEQTSRTLREQTARAIRGAFVLIPFTEISGSIKLIQGEINKGRILQSRLQQYVNRELPNVQAGFRKGRGTRDQIATIRWIIKKAREFQKNIYFCFIDYAKAFDCVDHNQLWKILNEMEYQTT